MKNFLDFLSYLVLVGGIVGIIAVVIKMNTTKKKIVVSVLILFTSMVLFSCSKLIQVKPNILKTKVTKVTEVTEVTEVTNDPKGDGIPIQTEYPNHEFKNKYEINDLGHIQSTDWEYDVLIYVLEEKIFEGDIFGEFEPDRNVTRAEFVKIFCNFKNSKIIKEKYKLSDPVDKQDNDSLPFEDVNIDLDKTWYLEYLLQVFSCLPDNYINAKKFEPTEPITREDVAVCLVKLSNIPLGGKNIDDLLKFEDHRLISDNAKKSIIVALKLSFMQGYLENYKHFFRPRRNMSRVEVAQVLYNMYKCSDEKIFSLEW